MFPIGTQLPGSFYHPERDRDIIAEVLPTSSGNTSVRIGHTMPVQGYQQTAYVTITPEERAHLIRTLVAQDATLSGLLTAAREAADGSSADDEHDAAQAVFDYLTGA